MKVSLFLFCATKKLDGERGHTNVSEWISAESDEGYRLRGLGELQPRYKMDVLRI